MNDSRHIAILAACILGVSSASGQTIKKDSTVSDTMSVILEHSITVTGTHLSRAAVDFPMEKDRFAQVLQSEGFDLARKGTFLAQDVHADGFKRGDIAIVVDGERYHSACPNRMDNPLVRTNSFEMLAIDLTKTSASAQSGLSGAVQYHREQPVWPVLIRAGASQSLAASEARDIGFAATARGHRLAGRYATGKGYDDADGLSFVDRYGYRNNYSYSLIETAVTGERAGLTYRADVMYTEDVMFPYLMMDERENTVISASAAFRGHKLYANYTDHLMDNGLRQSMGVMKTDATNLTIGANGECRDFGYDAYFRRWNADNNIVTPMISIANHLMPKVNQYAGTIFKQIEYPKWSAWGKAGVSTHRVQDDNGLAFFMPLYGELDRSRTDLTFGAGAGYSKAIDDNMIGTVLFDIASEAPPTEYLYLNVRRPMGNPWWAGNPDLDAPVRLSLRSSLRGRGAKIELFGAHVWDYNNFVRRSVGTQTYQTYANADAVMVGLNLSGSWRYLDVVAGYTWSENTTNDEPLAEIPPFALTYTVKSPTYQGLAAYARHAFNDAQTRVDYAINEETTPSWHRFDIGASYRLNAMRFSLEVTNLTDELYFQHLSYMRNPYSSGMRVHEPGRTVLLNVVFDTGVK